VTLDLRKEEISALLTMADNGVGATRIQGLSGIDPTALVSGALKLQSEFESMVKAENEPDTSDED